MKNQNLSTEELKETLYNNILNASLEGDKNLFVETLNLAKYNNIPLDLSYKDGLLPVLAAQKGHNDILKMLCSYDNNLISTHGVEILGYAASHGKIECVEFLLTQGVNPKELQSTTAYNNYQEVENIFNEYLKSHDTEHKDTVEISGNNLVLDIQY